MHRGLIAVVLLAVPLIGGCRGSLVREKDDLTVFDRRDRMRGEQVELYRYNEYGRRVPNLRGRLLKE